MTDTTDAIVEAMAKIIDPDAWFVDLEIERVHLYWRRRQFKAVKKVRAALAAAIGPLGEIMAVKIEGSIQVESTTKDHPTYWADRRPGNRHGIEYADLIRTRAAEIEKELSDG